MTADQVAAARKMFVAYDVDGDGAISRMDFHQAMSRYSIFRTPEQLDSMYASVDIQGTGSIDFLTFCEQELGKIRRRENLTPRAGDLPTTARSDKSPNNETPE